MTTIVRYTSYPAVLAADTIYLIQLAPDDLQVLVTGATAEVLSSSQTKATVQAAITAALSGLDVTNPVLVTDTIATRAALTPVKDSLVLVKDATGDATVTSGAALYFYSKTGDNYTKVSEYESLDITIPNKAILESLSVIEGRLAYNGVAVGNVSSGAHQW